MQHGVAVSMLGVAALTHPMEAHAGGERTVEDAITVSVGATCLDEKRLEQHVRGWLGRDAVPGDLRLQVVGDPQQQLVVEFWIRRQGVVRRRRFDPTPAGCEQTHAALGLAVAMAIDASVLERVEGLAPPEPTQRLAVAQIGAGASIVPGFSLAGALGFEHPSGFFVEERRALTILALARTGNRTRVAELAAQFVQSYPDGPFTGMVRAVARP